MSFEANELAEQMNIPSPKVDIPSTLVFSVPKAGSVLLNNMVQSLCCKVGLEWVDIPGYCFQNGIEFFKEPHKSQVEKIYQDTGYCYGGYRNLPRALNMPIVRKNKLCILVRDPRDMIVSHYYSMRYSHKPPKEETNMAKRFSVLHDKTDDGIDEYVLRVGKILNGSLNSYKELLSLKNVRVYKYEDVIFEKQAWMTDLMKHFEWDVPAEEIAEVVTRFDIVPGEERQDQHIRKVHPGDHKQKLKPETIEGLNKIFATAYSLYGYSA